MLKTIISQQWQFTGYVDQRIVLIFEDSGPNVPNTTIKNTTYQNGLFWEGLSNEVGYVRRDKNVTPVELNAGFKVTMLDSSP